MKRETRRVVVTGGAGFIGSAMVRYLLANTQVQVRVVDKLTYAATFGSALKAMGESSRVQLANLDICEGTGLSQLFNEFQPDSLIHFAAESHVDRSIQGAADFIRTNVEGTQVLLDAWRNYIDQESNSSHLARADMHFHFISTDEIYGDRYGLTPSAENTAQAASSPYAASKVAAQSLVDAWHRTYDLPVITSVCSNNYGPWQHGEKFIPATIQRALKDEPLAIYGPGSQRRNWSYVEDTVADIWQVHLIGWIGRRYHLLGEPEVANLDLVHRLCDVLASQIEQSPGFVQPLAEHFRSLITHVEDRPGHDRSYLMGSTWFEQDIERNRHGLPRHRRGLMEGLKETVAWYTQNVTSKQKDVG